jgi:drug/metabolite transporter (DMT)-like permease
LGNLQLFAVSVAIWGTTWLAIKFQLARGTPEASVFYRFFLGSMLLFAYCLARRLPLRYGARQHLWMAICGIFMFSVSYIFVYYAERYVVSGLVAVGYSASPLLGLLGARLFLGTPVTARVLAGSLLGIAGIALVFWPEFSRLRSDSDTALGAIFTMSSVLFSALGSIVAQRNQRDNVPLWQSMAWGMLYSALFSLAVTLVLGNPMEFAATPDYVLSLLHLTVLGSIVAFGAYLTLLKRVGAARAGYVGVMVPILALVVSAVFEGFHWQVLTVLGIAVSVAGNVIILRGK